MKIRVLLVLVVSVCCLAPYLRAAEKTAADLFPASTVAYAEIARPKEVLDLVFDHPLRKRVEELDQYKTALASKEGTQFRAGLVLIEFQLGMQVRPALEKISGGGIYLGVDPATNGVALLIKAEDQPTLEKVRDTLLKLARDDAKNNKRDDPFKSREYRGITAYQAGEARFATLGPWFIVTNKDDLGKHIVDQYLDGGAASLSGDKYFQAARAAISGQPAAWGYASLPPLRDSDAAKDLYKDKSDNPGAEVLLGGILSNLKQTPYATAALYLSTNEARLVASTPHDPAWVGKPREFYFGPGGKGAAPQPLVPKQTALSLGDYRDLSAMWLNKADLFDENVNAGLSQADSTLTTLMGRDFGREVLGALGPEMQLVVTRQDYQGLSTPEPDIKLPAGAMVFRLKDSQKMQLQFKVLFQSLMGFLNVVGAMQGQPPTDVNTEVRGEGKVVSATYLPDKSPEGKINYNFSPSIAFIGDLLIVSTTGRLAGELVDLAAAAKSAPAAEGPRDNTRIGVSVPVIRDLLQDNRKHLVAQNQLQKGHPKEAAEKEIDALLQLLSAVKDLSLRLSSDDKNLNLELGLRLETAK